MNGVLIKSRNLDTDMHTEGMACESEGRGQCGASLQAKDCQILPVSYQKLGVMHEM